jgi:hypothetical protein
LNSIKAFPVSLCNGIHLSLINNSPVTSSRPTTHSYTTDLQKLNPGCVLPQSQPARAEPDSERVTASHAFRNCAKKFKTLGSTISYIPELLKEVKNLWKYNLMHSGTAQRSQKPPETQSHTFRNRSKKLRIFGNTISCIPELRKEV